MSEQVMVFPEWRLRSFARYFDGCVIFERSVVNWFVDDILRPSVCSFMDREKAETDSSFKQVIPYCVFQRFDGAYFAYQRTKKSGESRLHDKWSIGVGGHINPCDFRLNWDGYYGPYAAALRRELDEEVGVSLEDDLSVSAPIVAVIYDPSNDVGLVHVGLVHIINYDSELKPSDPAIANGVWMSREELVSNKGSFENWSKLLIPYLA